ncbi:hypothetical protein TcBrA4_0032660 [Trypanosoma cruzi]|nr:hypothetical protein TcBrA4_0032660 [Trypanosoma cruzi]
MAIDVAPSTRLQYARMLRSMLEMDRTPLDMMILGLQKIAARPSTKEGMESIYPQPDRLEGTCCLTTCVDTGESLVRDCGLDSQKFHTGGGRNLNFGLVRGAEDGEGGSPTGALRFVRIRGQDAFDIIKLCRTLQENEKLTNLTTAQVERALASWNATAHSHRTRCVEARCSNRGDIQFESTRDLAVGEARQSVLTFPRILFDICGITPPLLTQVSSLVAIMRREKRRKGRNPG